MTIKEAMEIYFEKLNNLYKKRFDTLPTVSWSESVNQDLFVGDVDEDGEIQWKPKKANFIKFSNLCEELNDFYNTFYYWQLSGRYKNIDFYFDRCYSETVRNKIIDQIIMNGNYYFKNKNCVLIATCCDDSGNDDLLLFYNQDANSLFIYDADRKNITNLEYSLVKLISCMEALI